MVKGHLPISYLLFPNFLRYLLFVTNVRQKYVTAFKALASKKRSQGKPIPSKTLRHWVVTGELTWEKDFLLIQHQKWSILMKFVESHFKCCPLRRFWTSAREILITYHCPRRLLLGLIQAHNELRETNLKFNLRIFLTECSSNKTKKCMERFWNQH